MTTTRNAWTDTTFTSGDYIAWQVWTGQYAVVRITSTGSRYNGEWSVVSADGCSDAFATPPTGARLATAAEVADYQARRRPAPANY